MGDNMKVFKSPFVTRHFRRQWWWSQVPFWEYLHQGQGWANLVDKHPGMFNLAWALAGGVAPPSYYPAYATTTAWVLTESGHMPMRGCTVADAAFSCRLPEFLQKFKLDPLVMQWKFGTPDLDYIRMYDLLKAVAAQRA